MQIEYGLSVESKSESIIASQLERYNIPFRYEALLQLEGQIYYPDFTILRIIKLFVGSTSAWWTTRNTQGKWTNDRIRKRGILGKTSLQHMKQEHTR